MRYRYGIFQQNYTISELFSGCKRPLRNRVKEEGPLMILDFTFCTVPVFLRDAGIRTTTAASCATNEQHTHQLVQSV